MIYSCEFDNVRGDIKRIFATNFRNYRLIKGISLVDIALEIEVDYGYIRKLESTKMDKLPGVETMYRIAKVLDIPLCYLLQEECQEECKEVG